MLNAKKIHIIGGEGIGISALARVLEAGRVSVSSSDLETGGHAAANVPEDAELVIYSNAVPADNPERVRAAELGIKQMSSPEALGEYCRSRKIVAVAGTNGKTTTTAMIGTIMEKAGLDPTVVVGSKVLAWESNARVGKSEWVVIEADEYKRAFLNYEPDIAVITNISEDHLDYYKDLVDIKSAFAEFVSKIKPGGTLIYNLEDPKLQELTLTLSLSKRGDSPSFTKEGAGGSSCEAIGFVQGSFKLKVPGQFNQANAAAAAAACRVMGISESVIKQALSKFTGTWRRFQRIGCLGDTEIISDYAHHPDGVRVTLAAAVEEFDPKKILAVFQPHQHNRTKKLFQEFVDAFCSSKVENIIISEIFDVAGREENEDQDVSSKDLVREIQKCGKNVSYAADLQDCEDQIRKTAKDYYGIIVMGAGDIYKVADRLIK